MPDQNVYKIQRFSIHDGPGIRTTLFFQGCPLSCIWCHNPESQKKFTPDGNSDIKQICAGLLAQVLKDRMFYEQSGGGVTFSGGEPLMQPEMLHLLASKFKEDGIHTCLDTSGYAPLKVLRTLWDAFDLILYDLKLMDNDAHMEFAGRSLKHVCENLVFLSDMRAQVRLRFPMIPGITDTPQNIDEIRRFVLKNTLFRDIHILPLHKTAETKYLNLNFENKIKHLEVPGQQDIERVVQKFESYGFNVVIGG